LFSASRILLQLRADTFQQPIASVCGSRRLADPALPTTFAARTIGPRSSAGEALR
jgi:hypothetical protein